MILLGAAPASSIIEELAQRAVFIPAFNRICSSPQLSCSDAGPNLPHIVDQDGTLAGGVEQQAIDVVAQTLHVGAAAFTAKQAGASGVDFPLSAAAAIVRPSAPHRQGFRGTPHSTSVACFEHLVDAAARRARQPMMERWLAQGS